MNGGGLGNRSGDRDGGYSSDTIDKDDTNDVVITVSTGTFQNDDFIPNAVNVKCRHTVN